MTKAKRDGDYAVMEKRFINLIQNGKKSIIKMINDASSSKNFSESYFSYLKILIDQLSIENISKFIELILQTRENDKSIYFIGNGGSASTASHFVYDISLGSRQFE